jgi:hypothetical protein
MVAGGFQADSLPVNVAVAAVDRSENLEQVVATTDG